MCNTDHIDKLASLYRSAFGEEPSDIEPVVTGSASTRRYYRISGKERSVIGTCNNNRAENRAFFYLTKHFLSHGLKVPEVYCVDDDEVSYLQQDLGHTSLFDLMAGGFHPEHEPFLSDVLEQLVRFQVQASFGIDFNNCYPQPDYDRQSALWDMHYFKYMFLKLSGVDFDEALLEAEFSGILDGLFHDNICGFMYRDFQSRNIMMQHGSLWFIDYQGGRRGPLAYDVASLLYQSRIAIPEEVRIRLTDGYCDSLSELIPFDRKDFHREVRGFALLRLLQNLGAYGYRGIFEGKPRFIEPIVPAIKNTLETIGSLPDEIRPEYLPNLLSKMLPLFTKQETNTNILTVSVNSFSYMKGLPKDASGNGGGFIFDCRALPNPHRDEALRPLTGRDEAVKAWLDQKPEVKAFLESCEALVLASVKRYSERGFTNLQVNFGCTGGKHRSVYCAEKLVENLLPRLDDLKVCMVVKHLGGSL